MREPEYVVWEWLDVAGDPIYIGFGKMPYGKKEHPATALFRARKRTDSDLNIYLRELTEEPPRNPKVSDRKMYRPEARSIAYGRRKKAIKSGAALLSTREHGTTVGGGVARVVKDGKGTKYKSVRAAAAAYDVNQCTVTRWCTERANGWRYVT